MRASSVVDKWKLGEPLFCKDVFEAIASAVFLLLFNSVHVFFAGWSLLVAHAARDNCCKTSFAEQHPRRAGERLLTTTQPSWGAAAGSTLQTSSGEAAETTHQARQRRPCGVNNLNVAAVLPRGHFECRLHRTSLLYCEQHSSHSHIPAVYRTARKRTHRQMSGSVARVVRQRALVSRLAPPVGTWNPRVLGFLESTPKEPVRRGGAQGVVWVKPSRLGPPNVGSRVSPHRGYCGQHTLLQGRSRTSRTQ